MAKIGLIHIGKTGGTAVNTALREHNESGDGTRIRLFAHKWTFEKILVEGVVEKVAFFIREPVSRYVSGFNSRLRQGYPRHVGIWSPREEIAFERFRSPNQLGEALGSEDPDERQAARQALKAIKHCRLSYEHYLGSVELLEREKPRIAFIGAQESLDADFGKLKSLLGARPDLSMPTDDVGAHRNPGDADKHMSEAARANIQAYYTTDYEIYRWCQAHREKLLEQI